MDNNNLPAYPNLDSYETGGTCTPQSGRGLTKRELISAMCLQGILANHGDSGAPFSAFAEAATHYADALLTHLENTQK